MLAAPLGADTLHSPTALRHEAVAFLAFSLAASGICLINDVVDADGDRAHPTKLDRPIAAGVVPSALAAEVAVGMSLNQDSASYLGFTWVPDPALDQDWIDIVDLLEQWASGNLYERVRTVGKLGGGTWNIWVRPGEPDLVELAQRLGRETYNGSPDFLSDEERRLSCH